jgi:hypothetical protein
MDALSSIDFTQLFSTLQSLTSTPKSPWEEILEQGYVPVSLSSIKVSIDYSPVEHAKIINAANEQADRMSINLINDGKIDLLDKVHFTDVTGEYVDIANQQYIGFVEMVNGIDIDNIEFPEEAAKALVSYYTSIFKPLVT